MLTWKVAWWEPGAHPAGRPDGGGFVPGVDWHQAIDNARYAYGLPPAYHLQAWKLFV